MPNELLLRPQLVLLQPTEDGEARTTTTIDVNHPAVCPSGTFEYQHALAGTAREAFEQGLQGWMETDLPVFLHALGSETSGCTSMRLEMPAKRGRPARERTVVLGPTVHLAQREGTVPEEPHDFCPCCLFTQSTDASSGPLASDAFVGIRLYALRNAEGMTQADCRISGIESESGIAALCAYAGSWPERGLEYRKQFVAIRSRPGGEGQ